MHVHVGKECIGGRHVQFRYELVSLDVRVHSVNLDKLPLDAAFDLESGLLWLGMDFI